MRVLIVEDDPDISQVLQRGLTEEGCAVDLARDGEDGAFKAANPAYDVIVLDLLLPKVDGLTVLRGMRAAGLMTPVLVLTARDAVADRIRGLDAGADDYLVKPFAFGEFLARIRALRRRVRRDFDPLLRAGQLTLDQTTRRVRWVRLWWTCPRANLPSCRSSCSTPMKCSVARAFTSRSGTRRWRS